MKVTVEGFDRAQAALKAVSAKFRRGVLQRALTKAYAPVARAAKANARRIPKDTGTLARAVQARSKRRDRTALDGGAWYGVGVANQTSEQPVAGWRGKKYMRRVTPSKYAHLKERGFTHPSGKALPGYPLFSEALRSAEGQAINSFNRILEEELIKAFHKGRAGASAAKF